MSAELIQVSSKSQSKLRQVYYGPQVQTLFIVLPGVGSLQTDSSWYENDENNWLRLIKPSPISDVGIFVFANHLAADGALSWQQIEEEGAGFLGALYDLTQIQELQDCPIVIFAHSLSGSIFKRAVWLAHRQSQRFQALLQHIAGAIFLGSPHSQSDNVEAWAIIPLILKTYSKSKLKHAVSQELASGLAEDCLIFEQVFGDIPILSLYETAETKTGGMFGPKMILVDKAIANTNTGTSLHGVKLDHENICFLKSHSHEIALLISFVDSATKRINDPAKKNPQDYLGALTSERSQTLSYDSVRSHVKPVLDQGTKPSVPIWSPPQNPPLPSKSDKTGSTIDSFEMLSLLDFSGEKNEPRLPCRIIPLSHNRGFFGRKSVLDAVEKALCPGGNTDEPFEDGGARLKAFAIYGPGGMGKTQIAAEFVHRYKAKFDAVFWVHADETSKIAQDFNHIAITLGLVNEDSVEARDQILTRDLLLGWLAQPLKSYKRLEHQKPEEASFLLVFDNADNLEILDDFLPMESAGSVLITSRDPYVKTYIHSSDICGISLPSFDLDEATNFLLKLTNRENEVAERKLGTAIVEALGGLPLAITQMAGVIARNDLDFQEFLDMYDKESAHAQLFKLQIGQLKRGTKYDHTIATVWALEGLDESAASLLGVISLLDPDGIPEYILEGSETRFQWEGYPQDTMAYQLARAELLKSSLITRDRSTKKIFVHRLIQDASRANMSDDRFNLAFGFTLGLLSARWPYEAFGFGNEQYRWARCNELYRQVLRMKKFYSRLRPSTELSAASLEPPKFLLDLARFSILSSKFTDTVPFLTMAQSMCGQLRIIQAPSEAKQIEFNENFETLLRMFYHHRGELGLHTNQPQVSLSSYHTFIQMLRDKIGDTPRGKDQSLGVAWNELGCAFLQNDTPIDAEGCFKKSIGALSALENATRIGISMPLINLAFAYWLQNRLEDAASTFQDALNDREKEYGVNDRTSFVTGKLLIGFGNVKAAQGQTNESFTLHQRCLLHYKHTVGNNHHRTGDGCVKVSDHYVRLGKYSDALSLLEQAQKIFSDQDHFMPEKARVTFKKSKLFKLMGKHPDAEKSLRQASQLFQTIRPSAKKFPEELQDSDFDNAIMFWSR